MRNFSACVGQIAALDKIGILSETGAVSSVSGSCWFYTIFSFSPESLSNEVLLGTQTYQVPESLSLQKISTLDRSSIGQACVTMSNAHILAAYRAFMITRLPSSQVIPFIFSKTILAPFGLDDQSKYITLNKATGEDIQSRNPYIGKDRFLFMRSELPFYIASATLMDITRHTLYRPRYHYSYTPLYCGTPQTGYNVVNKLLVGGGFIENIGFNAHRADIDSCNNTLTVQVPASGFSLSDVVGSSGYAPGSIFFKIGLKRLTPEYHYMPVQSCKVSAPRVMTFVDGGNFDDTGILALLFRGYDKIIVFMNSGRPIGGPGRRDRTRSVDGIDGGITRLFGHLPRSHSMNNVDIQVFPQEQYYTLVEGLTQSKESGDGVPFFCDTYNVVQPNPFGIPAYKKGVTVLWVYNDKNQKWFDRLPADIRALFTEKDDPYKLSNFPHYKTILQNAPEIFSLSKIQVNLMANMWYFSLMNDNKLHEKLKKFAFGKAL